MFDKLIKGRILFISIIICSFFLFATCDFKPESLHKDNSEELLLLDSILKISRNIDSLSILAENYIRENNKIAAIMILRRMGKLSRDSNDFIKSIEHLNRALSLAEDIDDNIEIALCLNQLGTNYRRVGDYEYASNYHYRALNYCEQYKGKDTDLALKNKIISLNGIGNIYLTLDNFDAADAMLRAALEGEIELGSHLGMAINYANIGTIFEHREMYDSAKVYYERSMEQNILAKSSLGISLCHNHFGHLAELEGNFDKALQEYYTAYNIMDKTADRWHWMEACLSIVRVNAAKGDIQTAVQYLARAETTATELKSSDYLTIVYEMKYNYFEKEGNLRSALDNYILSRQYADSTLNLKNINHINNLRVRYETEQKQLKISILEEEKRWTTWLAIAIVSILLLTLTIFLFLWRWTAQKKRFAEQQAKQFEQEKQLIATQAVFEGETRERKRLSRDLHDGLGSILAATKYNLVGIKKTTETINLNMLDKAMSLLDESMKEMRRIAHHLMPESLSCYGLKQAISDFCESISCVKFCYYGNETNLDLKISVMLYRIMHELVSNALKHSGASNILVQMIEEPERVTISVQDNGCGFNYSAESKGMGLTNIRTRVAAYNGILLIDSQLGVGTEVNVELKIEKS